MKKNQSNGSNKSVSLKKSRTETSLFQKYYAHRIYSIIFEWRNVSCVVSYYSLVEMMVVGACSTQNRGCIQVRSACHDVPHGISTRAIRSRGKKGNDRTRIVQEASEI